MKNVIFKKVGAENFCSYIDPIDLDFENSKLILITGRNGVGKSSLIQSIPFTLFGNCEKGKNEDVVNSRIGKDCHTFLEFDIDNMSYRVDRYVKYKSIGNTATIKKSNEKNINWKKISEYKKGHREVTNECENLLVPSKLFNNTLLFSQKVKTFFTDLTDSDQKEIFRKILKLDEYVEYYNQTSRKIIEIDNDINNVKNQITSINMFVQDSKLNIENLEKQEDLFYTNQKIEILKIQNLITEKNNEILSLSNMLLDKGDSEKIEQEISDKRSYIAKLKEQMINLDNDKSYAIKKMDENFQHFCKDKESQRDINIGNINLKREKELSLLKEEYNTNNIESKYKDQFHKIENEKNILSNFHKDEYNKKLTLIRDETNTHNSRMNDEYMNMIQKITNHYNNEKEKLNISLSRLKEKYAGLKSLLISLENELKRLNIDLQKFNNSIIDDNQICPTCLQSLKGKTDEIKKHIDEIKDNISDITNKQTLSLKELQETENNINQINLEISNLDDNFSENKLEISEYINLEKEKLNKIFTNKLQVIKDEEISNSVSLQKFDLELEKLKQEYFNEKNKIENHIKINIDKINNSNDSLIKTYMDNCQLDIDNEKQKYDSDKELAIIKYNDKQKLLMDEATENVNMGNKLITLLKEITELKNKISLFNNEISNYQTQINSLNNQKFDKSSIEIIKNSIKNKHNELKELSVKETILLDKLKIYNFWKIGFSSSGIQSMLIDESIPFMNQRANEYLELISNGRYKLSFDTLKATKSGEFKDKISVNVFDTMTLSDSRIKFSGGQERLVDIATILTLSDLQEKIQNISFNVILFDELFDSLDNANIEMVSNLLKLISKQKSVVIISHRNIESIEPDICLNLT